MNNIDIDYRPFRRNMSEFEDVSKKIIDNIRSSVDETAVSVRGLYNNSPLLDSNSILLSNDQFCIEIALNKLAVRKIIQEQELQRFDNHTSRDQMARVIAQSLLDECYQLLVNKLESVLGVGS